MKRYVLMKLRIANKDDFFDQWDKKRLGTIYFLQSATGEICTQPYYFTEETDKDTFRELYTHNQIYVPERLFEEVEIVEEKPEPITQQQLQL
jgi:hypothetical protein